MKAEATQDAPSEDVTEYKRILQAVLENRPSGTRQRLAAALGKNRSFISQITGPGYAVPIPRRHLETIFEICHLSAPKSGVASWPLINARIPSG